MTNTAIAAHLSYINAAAAEVDATSAAQAAFESSAESFAAALFDDKVSASSLARDIKSALPENLSRRDRGLAYTSPAAVLFHARTGSWLRLDDDIDTVIDARDVQALVKKIKAELVDEILDLSDTRGDAYLRLVSAAAAADKAAAEDEEPEGDEDSEGDDDTDPVGKALDVLLKAARGPVRKVADRRTAGEELTDDARVVAREIAALLDTILAPESVTVTAPADAPVVVNL